MNSKSREIQDNDEYYEDYYINKNKNSDKWIKSRKATLVSSPKNLNRNVKLKVNESIEHKSNVNICNILSDGEDDYKEQYFETGVEGIKIINMLKEKVVTLEAEKTRIEQAYNHMTKSTVERGDDYVNIFNKLIYRFLLNYIKMSYYD